MSSVCWQGCANSRKTELFPSIPNYIPNIPKHSLRLCWVALDWSFTGTGKLSLWYFEVMAKRSGPKWQHWAALAIKGPALGVLC